MLVMAAQVWLPRTAQTHFSMIPTSPGLSVTPRSLQAPCPFPHGQPPNSDFSPCFWSNLCPDCLLWCCLCAQALNATLPCTTLTMLPGPHTL